MFQIIQELIDKVWEETGHLPTPPPNHPAMLELLSIPEDVATPILLEMLQMDPCRIHLVLLRQLHGANGAQWPTRDDGHMVRICEHWSQWGIARNYLGCVDPDEETDEDHPK